MGTEAGPGEGRADVVVVLEYEGKRYAFLDTGWRARDFGSEHELREAVDFQWRDGNYACDCNRALFIQRRCDDDFPDMECGETIKLLRLTVNGDDINLAPETARTRVESLSHAPNIAVGINATGTLPPGHSKLPIFVDETDLSRAMAGVSLITDIASGDPFHAWYPGSHSTCMYCGVERNLDADDPPEKHGAGCFYRRSKEWLADETSA